ncbi:MAG: hypothetical protein LBV38_04560 [Alistipes sp.]|jgi:predicted small lipoprotein YifL|nr:hypothetical protein [Alistipes sp.]
MKTLKNLLLTMATLALTLSLPACGEKNGLYDGDGDDIPGQLEQGWNESGNTMTYSAEYSFGGVSSSFIYTFTFSGDECTKATYAFTYPTEEQARADWDNMWEEDKAKATISGRTITEDVTEEWQGYSRAELRTLIN